MMNMMLRESSKIFAGEIQLLELRLVSLVKSQLRHHIESYEEKDFIHSSIKVLVNNVHRSIGCRKSIQNGGL